MLKRMKTPEPVTREAMFMGLFGDVYRGQKVYPRWMYKDGLPPILVKDLGQENKAKRDGYDSISSGAMANPYLINWFWDFEDMSPKQLRVFAKEEYGVEFLPETDQETLFKCVVELTRHAPQNKNRMVLMAHSVKMNYDATLDEDPATTDSRYIRR